MKFLIITILNGEVAYISKARTERGAEASKRYSLKLWSDTRFTATVKIISVDEILAWDSRGIEELERLAKL